MSPRRARASASGNEPEDDSVVRLVLLTSTGQRDEMSVSLRQSLAEFKTVLSQNQELGNIPVEHQRLFYLGREIKTPGRTLEALGVGKFGICVVHIHNTSPNNSRRPKRQRRQPPPAAAAALVVNNSGARGVQPQQPVVLDLVESEDEKDNPNDTKHHTTGSDDDDDEVCVVGVVSKRQRMEA